MIVLHMDGEPFGKRFNIGPLIDAVEVILQLDRGHGVVVGIDVKLLTPKDGVLVGQARTLQHVVHRARVEAKAPVCHESIRGAMHTDGRYAQRHAHSVRALDIPRTPPELHCTSRPLGGL